MKEVLWIVFIQSQKGLKGDPLCILTSKGLKKENNLERIVRKVCKNADRLTI